jgi:hypothetical protein
MSSVEPLKRYLAARDALARGDRDEAAAAAEEALGSQEGNAFIRRNLERLLDHETLAGESALDLVRVEMNQ